jgi:hypothetical protein
MFKYFVSYSYGSSLPNGFGFGCATITMDHQFGTKDMEDVISLQQVFMAKYRNFTSVTILNVIPLPI